MIFCFLFPPTHFNNGEYATQLIKQRLPSIWVDFDLFSYSFFYISHFPMISPKYEHTKISPHFGHMPHIGDEDNWEIICFSFPFSSLIAYSTIFFIFLLEWSFHFSTQFGHSFFIYNFLSVSAFNQLQVEMFLL